MPADLIVYAIVAAGLIFWLRSILGTRHEDERERPNPYVEAVKAEATSDAPKTELSIEDKIMQLSGSTKSNVSVDNKTAENALIEIAKADKSFDIEHFAQGAQDAFVMIVEAFAEGDRETLGNLLSEPVYKAFDAAITEQEKNDNTEEVEILAINKAEILSAKIKDKIAYITIRFIADETRVVRDKDGEIVSGDPDKVTKMKDIWTFGRKINSKSPAWLVYETRSDDADDNQHIPNTH